MKLVIYYHQYASTEDFVRSMEIIKSLGEIVKTVDDDPDYIYVKYNKQIYKFNRYDKNFILRVEQIYNENLFKNCPGINYEGPFFICDVDDRFKNKKYYDIDVTKRNKESLTILKDVIIEDLYYKNYDYCD